LTSGDDANHAANDHGLDHLQILARRTEKDLVVVGSAMHLLEIGDAILAAPDGFAVHRRRRDLQRGHRLDDAGIAIAPIKASAGEEPHPIAVAAGDQAIAIVLDLVQPLWTGGRLSGDAGEAWLDEAARALRAMWETG
jgi:hypothetical protein